ncbi:uncharacterized protein [Nicotiana tomentosiformis]|uniref:uncharacterized protein n=1 Tax=Nicotiana tomentosiformis TaxID=4098 RepID=UPI00388C58DC
MHEAEKETTQASLQIHDLWALHTDGASNACGSGLGLILNVPTGEVIHQSIRYPDMTNNKAEYEVIIEELTLALEYRAKRLKLHCDSQLVVNQNIEADSLAKLAVVTKSITPGDKSIVHLLSSALDQIEDDILPNDKKEAKKLRMQDARYNLLHNNLYKRAYGVPLAKCLLPNQNQCTLEEVHEGHCGAYFGDRVLVRCLIQVGYYWPTMKKDASEFVKKCKLCHKYAPIICQVGEHLYSVTSPWPFIKWGMDIVGPLPPG